jgi:hypothetical protein
MALLVVGAFVKIPGFHNFPAAVVISSSFCLALSFQAINRRLPLILMTQPPASRVR